MSNQINAKIDIPEKFKIHDKKRVGPNRQLTLERVISYIQKHGFDEYTTNGLIDLASSYPTNALPSFRKNFNLMIARVRQKRKEEQHELENKTERKPNGEENSQSQSEV